MNEDFRMEQGYKEAAYGDSLGRYTAKTFGWMFIGLLITFGVAIGMYMTDGPGSMRIRVWPIRTASSIRKSARYGSRARPSSTSDGIRCAPSR